MVHIRSTCAIKACIIGFRVLFPWVGPMLKWFIPQQKLDFIVEMLPQITKWDELMEAHEYTIRKPYQWGNLTLPSHIPLVHPPQLTQSHPDFHVPRFLPTSIEVPTSSSSPPPSHLRFSNLFSSKSSSLHKPTFHLLNFLNPFYLNLSLNSQN